MPVGMQIFDAAGRLALDMTNRVPKIVANIAIGNSDGSASVPFPGNSEVFFMFSPAGYVSGVQTVLPYFSYSSGVVSWVFDTAYCNQNLPITKTAGTLFVGAF